MSERHPHDWRRDRSKPRVIRKVTGKDAEGRAQVAIDKKAQITMERVTARASKPCTYHACPMPDKMITSGTEYAKVARNTDMKRMGSRSVPDPKDFHFHFDCVPPEARPLVRFLVSRNPTAGERERAHEL